MEFLDENVLTKHADMLRLVPPSHLEMAKERTQEIVDAFKGNRARMQWALRWHRIWLFVKFGTDAPLDYTKGMTDPWVGASELHMLLPFFNHIMTVPYDPIQKYNWDHRKMPSVVRRELEELERVYMEKKPKEVEHQDFDRPIVEFPDGFVWMDLNRASCDEEGRAMGHCGNGGRHNGTILSLRKRLKSGRMVPHLTFILDEGYLGEMKGRANEKPAEKYHSYIIELLHQEKRIKGIRGGGYLPESNFDLRDLDIAEVDKLMASRPDFERPLWYLAHKKQYREIEEQTGFKVDAESEELLLARIDMTGWYNVHRSDIKDVLADEEDGDRIARWWLKWVTYCEAKILDSVRFKSPFRNARVERISGLVADVYLPLDELNGDAQVHLGSLSKARHRALAGELRWFGRNEFFTKYGLFYYHGMSQGWVTRPIDTEYLIRYYHAHKDHEA